MKKFSVYLRASRLHLFSLAFGGIFLGTAYGMRVSGAFNTAGFLIAVLIGLLGHIATSFANEWADDEADAANKNRTLFNGGTGLLQSGEISKIELKRGWQITALLAIVLTGIAVFLMNAHVVLLASSLIGLILGLGYSIKPLVLSRRGLGELAAFVGYGIPMLICGAVMQMSRIQVSSALSDIFFYLLVIPGALGSFAVLSLTMIPDTVWDRSTGRKSVSVLFGEGFVIRMAAAALAAAAGVFALLYSVSRCSPVCALISGAVPLLVAILILFNLNAWRKPTGKAMTGMMMAGINAAMASFLIPAVFLLFGNTAG